VSRTGEELVVAHVKEIVACPRNESVAYGAIEKVHGDIEDFHDFSLSDVWTMALDYSIECR
jgi:hypothetical protein